MGFNNSPVIRVIELLSWVINSLKLLGTIHLQIEYSTLGLHLIALFFFTLFTSEKS